MFSIQEVRQIAQEVVKATCSILEDVKVVLVDQYGNYMAMDDSYVMMKGTSEWKPYIDEICRRKEVIIIDNPGENELCRGCMNYMNCPQTLEISVPFNIDELFIGYISIVTFSEYKKEKYLERSDKIVGYLEAMVALMTSAAKERAEKIKSLRLSLELQAALNAVDYCIVDCDKQGCIRYINDAFVNLTGLSREIVGQQITDIIDSKVLLQLKNKQKDLDEQELPLLINNKLYRVLLKVKTVISSNEVCIGQVYSFRSVHEVRKVLDDRGGLHVHGSNMVIGKSPEMKQLKKKIENIALSSSTILIKGETGTGKELVARAIHGLSERKDGPFVTINCAAIPENLLESELFGYEDGAFTGGRKGGKAGLFEIANEGTLFLDEIGDMPLHLQVKLLRVLQEKEIMRIGGTVPMDLDIRLISATHQNLEELMSQGMFRTDLYYRLNIFPIHIPPLRERLMDLSEYLNYFIGKYNKVLGKQVKGFSEAYLHALLSYPWPGNIRELENSIEYGINVETSSELTPNSLCPSLIKYHVNKQDKKNLKQSMEAFEKQLLLEHLSLFQNEKNAIEKAAVSLGLSRASMYRKVKAYGITPM